MPTDFQIGMFVACVGEGVGVGCVCMCVCARVLGRGGEVERGKGLGLMDTEEVKEGRHHLKCKCTQSITTSPSTPTPQPFVSLECLYFHCGCFCSEGVNNFLLFFPTDGTEVNQLSHAKPSEPEWYTSYYYEVNVICCFIILMRVEIALCYATIPFLPFESHV